jgi:hypothetical protein
MLIPVFNKESAADELMRLCTTLCEARKHCKDNNFNWRIAQLANQAEDLYNDFLSAFNLSGIALNVKEKSLFERMVANHTNGDEVFLSFAFSIAAGMDAAHYEKMALPEDFKIKLHGLSRNILSLLHEYRDEIRLH